MKNKAIFSNGWRDFGSDGLEYWLPTIIWVVFEINHFSFFEICFDFWTMDFYFVFFGFKFGFQSGRGFHYSRTKLKTNKIERIQISFSCAIYWHFFQYYRDDPDYKIDILGMEIELNEENRF